VMVDMISGGILMLMGVWRMVLRGGGEWGGVGEIVVVFMIGKSMPMMGGC
jgi:hypothetical protein